MNDETKTKHTKLFPPVGHWEAQGSFLKYAVRFDRVTLNERRNLVAVSALAFVYAWFDWQVKSLNGGIVQIQNIHPAEPYWIFIGLVGYFLWMMVHYVNVDYYRVQVVQAQRTEEELVEALKLRPPKTTEGDLSTADEQVRELSLSRQQERTKDRVNEEEHFNNSTGAVTEFLLPTLLAVIALIASIYRLFETRGGLF